MKRTMQQIKRQKRIRKKIQGTQTKPRLTVFRSNKHIYAQLIDDAAGKTLLVASDVTSDEKKNSLQAKPVEKAKLIGLDLAKLALTHKIKQVIFDKGSYAYHGRVKALAEGAREGGLQF
ncbi:MAG: 50S ribosomal protein L18 [Candidatus Levybacteria bacterium]|nr:50S ribosomal protein L18 [Candidatus Levybacteria bacterium]